jgi:hypothetical protein
MEQPVIHAISLTQATIEAIRGLRCCLGFKTRIATKIG